MKLGIVLNTKDPETAWNVLRLGNEALAGGHEARLFLLGPGVELETINDERFDVPEVLKKFVGSGGNLFACGTCLQARLQEGGVCPVSTMSDLLKIIADSDRVITFG